MSGAECIGLILNILPIVADVVDWYSNRIRGRESKQLADSLKNNKQIFLNSIEFLLRNVVSPEKVQTLLKSPGGEAWSDESLVDQMHDHLGDEAEGIINKSEDIYKTLVKLQEKLPSRELAKTDKNLLVRGKHIIKCFVQGKSYKTSLEGLKNSVGEFRTLTEDAVKLAPQRCVVPRALKNLDLVQECASDLHDALQASWPCDCDHDHPANIKLDVWSSTQEKGAEKGKDAGGLKFSFLFAKDANRAHADHWVTIEYSKSSPNGSPQGSPIRGQPLSQNSSGGSTKRSVKLQSGSSSAISLSRSFNVPSKVQDNVDAVDEETMADVIQDLCALMKQAEERSAERPVERPPTTRRRLGSISSPTRDVGYDLFNEPDQLPISQTRRSVRLAELLVKHDKLSMKNRVRIAMMLAWGVLQISSTGWLSGKWTKENILLVTDAPNNPLPYVTHRFLSSRRMSESTGRRGSNASTLDPEVTNHIADWIKNASLFALGVFLLEMAYNRTIEDLAIAEEKKVGQYTQFLTAMRLANGVQDELGMCYSQAVNACLNATGVTMDTEGNPKDPSQFVKSIWKNIIEPLKTCADTFEDQTTGASKS